MQLHELAAATAAVERIKEIVDDLVDNADKWMVLEVEDFKKMNDADKKLEIEDHIDHFFDSRYQSAKDQRFISRNRAEIVRQVVSKLAS